MDLDDVDVRAGEREIEPMLGRRCVETRGGVVKPSRAAAACLGRLRHRAEKLDLARIGGREHIAAPVEIDEIPASKAALELFDPAFVIGGSKPITRCTASDMRTR